MIGEILKMIKIEIIDKAIKIIKEAQKSTTFIKDQPRINPKQPPN